VIEIVFERAEGLVSRTTISPDLISESMVLTLKCLTVIYLALASQYWSDV
jgi:hypothetical protein